MEKLSRFIFSRSVAGSFDSDAAFAASPLRMTALR
jgi:hypothetical protein